MIYTTHFKNSKELAALVTCEVGVNMRKYLKYSGLAESLLKKKVTKILSFTLQNY